MKNYIVLSGMWIASMYVGSLIGPSVAGLLVDAYGFAWTTIVFFGLYSFITIVDICILTFSVWKSMIYGRLSKAVCKDTESLPLLE